VNCYLLPAGLALSQGIGVYFQVPRNYQVLEEILTAKKTATRSIREKKSKKEEKKGPKNKNLFDFFDFAVNLFFKVRCFSGNIDVEKVNADALALSPLVFTC
jgi:hypothetical protein